ncbi:hypothetical protein EVAR_47022_1 [Eumeta japonica]|uniref:Uncharacterized protein n=1 Tax=Eumeta variegata TaxID=151549 RepID=A0A4C1XK52_EUMVA|nr:hypothetical protein EVAR_47022_1 [Eumeta japonica]
MRLLECYFLKNTRQINNGVPLDHLSFLFESADRKLLEIRRPRCAIATSQTYRRPPAARGRFLLLSLSVRDRIVRGRAPPTAGPPPVMGRQKFKWRGKKNLLKILHP